MTGAVDFLDLRTASARNLPALLALNNAAKVETSELDAARMAPLLDSAFVALATSDGSALLISFDQAAAYDSPNFRWFRSRYARFVYVDRVVVAERRRGQGLARRLYETVFDVARAAGHTCVVCEVNVDPPNPASDAVHAALGFTEVGRALLANGKLVRYLECPVAARPVEVRPTAPCIF